MTAIDTLLEEACRLDLFSHSDVFPAMAEVEDTIRSLLEDALYLNEQLSGMVFPLVEFRMPMPEAAEEEPLSGKDMPASSQAYDQSVNIGSININSTAMSVRESLQKFESQTSGITSIFSGHESEPDILKSGIESLTERYHELLIKAENVEGIDKIRETGSAESRINASEIMNARAVSEELKQSAAMISELEAVRNKVMESSVDSAITEIARKVLDEKSIFTGEHTASEISRAFSEEVSRSAAHSSISSGKSIDVPAFVPRRKTSGPPEEASMNAARLNEAIASSQRIDTGYRSHLVDERIQKTEISGTKLQQPMSIKPISGTMSAMYSYMAEISKLNELRETAMFSENEIISGMAFNPVAEMLSAGSESIRLIDNMVPIYGNIPGGETANGISLMIAASGALQAAGSPDINSITMMAPYYRSESKEFSLTTAPRAMDTVLQMIQGTSGLSRPEQAARTSNFYSTFNITVNVKSGNDENELRELGKKIGVILSEELKRYGGI
ncbi:hypothetical protein CUJ83_04845 [Methanocella sp. CWC-04]|uniref:Uncharacterized protein n=1 Tax=Methanooceanicella nereidis TaxID=2052831 RepID=A0AAP2RE15_9EURY|nr:hypothetical protein [Methanocella sp. CWC-04]MCD1294325.1 hypothetical protein [Methanocella sp. CWC-04]